MSDGFCRTLRKLIPVKLWGIRVDITPSNSLMHVIVLSVVRYLIGKAITALVSRLLVPHDKNRSHVNLVLFAVDRGRAN